MIWGGSSSYDVNIYMVQSLFSVKWNCFLHHFLLSESKYKICLMKAMLLLVSLLSCLLHDKNNCLWKWNWKKTTKKQTDSEFIEILQYCVEQHHLTADFIFIKLSSVMRSSNTGSQNVNVFFFFTNDKANIITTLEMFLPHEICNYTSQNAQTSFFDINTFIKSLY